MSGDIEWGPWIEHDGKGCPCVGLLVETVWEAMPGQLRRWRGFVTPEFAPCFDWSNHLKQEGRLLFGRVMRYRIRRPSALQTLIEIAANPAPLPEEVSA